MTGYPRLKGLAALMSVLLSACAAGGSTGGGSSPSTAQPSRTDAVAVSFSVHVSSSSAKSKARHTSGIPATTMSVRIGVLDSTSTPAVGSPFTLDTSASSTACVGSGAARTCSMAINVPIDTDTFTATAFDGPNGTGALLTTVTLVQQMYLNAANTISISLPQVLAETITSGLFASATGNAITLLVNPGASAFLSISGGTGTYTVAATCATSIVTLTPQSGGYNIQSGGIPGTCNITISDGVVSLTPTSVNVVAYPTPSAGSLDFNSGLGPAAQQAVTISGGVQPFTVSASPTFLTTGIASNVLSAYPNSAGSGTIVVRDSLGGIVSVTATATTVTIPILSHH